MQNFVNTQNATGNNMAKSLIASIVLAVAAATPAFASIEWQWDFSNNANPSPANIGDPAATAGISVGQVGITTISASAQRQVFEIWARTAS